MQDDLRRITDYFKDRDEVSALYIFGSAARGKETAESDIDIAVLINDRKKGRKTYESLKKSILLRLSEIFSAPHRHCSVEHSPAFSETPYYQNRQSAF